MFTVCPKCALTLVVTAADLRVAQGYVRCGRCSNVFNALARLSEDKGAAAATQTQGNAPSAATSAGTQPKPQPNGAAATQPQTPAAPTRPPQATGSFVYPKPPDMTPPASERSAKESPAGTPRPPQQPAGPTQPPAGTNGAAGPRPAQQPAAAPKPTPVAPIPAQTPSRAPSTTPSQPFSSAPAPTQPSARAPSAPPEPAASQPPAPSPTPRPLPIELNLDDDDDAIPEDALEFNADADVNQFFVESTPSAEWTAATGTFKSIVLKSEEPTPPPDEPESGSLNPAAVTTPLAAKVDPRHAYPPPAEFNSTFEDDEIELDADFLSGTAEMRRLQTTGAGDELTQLRTPAPQQPHVAPSARMAPRGSPPPETPAPTPALPRAPTPEVPTRAAPKQPIPVELEPDAFPEPEVVSVARTPSRTPARAFGLEPEKQPRESLGSLARSVEATATPGRVEPLPPERAWLTSPLLWNAGTGAMILLLAIQVLNHYRNDLAATPQFNKSITALYSAFGIQLTPRWDLHAYDVRQLGASVDSANAGEIMVRASVKNGARQAQPMPLLRVTLQDRYGNRIAARDVAPGNYLPRATADIGYLPAGQRIDAEMAFVDPGSNAVGFEIDACLPAPAGGIACANDPVSR